MPQFQILASNNDLKEILKSAFDAELDIAGDWGYTQETATILHDTSIPLSQIEHMFASMRAYVEMNMTLEESQRYGSINLNERFREEYQSENKHYHKVTYEITAMIEKVYASFINAYKEGYGKADFDMTKHFKDRKEATLTREVIHYFDVSAVSTH